VLNIERYVADKHVFPANVAVNEELFTFKMSGEIEIPTLDAKAFKETKTEGRIKLTYKNKLVRLRNGVKKYCFLQRLSLAFKDKEYTIVGEIVLSEEIRQSAEFTKIKKEQEEMVRIERQKQDEESERLRKAEENRKTQQNLERQAEVRRQQELKEKQQKYERQRIKKEFGSIRTQAIVMSALVPGLGSWRVSQGKKNGIVPMVATYSLLGGGIWSFSEYLKNKRNYQEAQTQEEIDKSYNAANLHLNIFGWLLGAGVTVWACNVIWVATYKPAGFSVGSLYPDEEDGKVVLQMGYLSGGPGLALKVRF